MAGERFGSVFSHLRAFFRLSADGILCPRPILTRAPDFSVSFLHFVLPDTGKGTGGRFGRPNQASVWGKNSHQTSLYVYLDLGGPRAWTPLCVDLDPPVHPVGPGGAAERDVTGSRAEPGSTRLSQDDGSIRKANSLKLSISSFWSFQKSK